jgi:hypothetical protein
LYRLPYLPNNTKMTKNMKKLNRYSQEFYRPFSPYVVRTQELFEEI